MALILFKTSNGSHYLYDKIQTLYHCFIKGLWSLNLPPIFSTSLPARTSMSSCYVSPTTLSQPSHTLSYALPPEVPFLLLSQHGKFIPILQICSKITSSIRLSLIPFTYHT